MGKSITFEVSRLDFEARVGPIFYSIVYCCTNMQGAEQRAGKYVRERKKRMIRSMHAFYNKLVVSIG